MEKFLFYTILGYIALYVFAISGARQAAVKQIKLFGPYIVRNMNKSFMGYGVIICLMFIGCSIETRIPKWNECTKSSNWHGQNASQRMMNILSPNMPDSVFHERMSFMKSRGANTAHLIICNKADGEYANYCIYGNDITWIVNKNFTNLMTTRIKELRKEKFGIILWLMTDDSYDWNIELAKNFNQYICDIEALGWLKYASTIVIGLELDEYYTEDMVVACVNAIRNKYKGKIGVHHTNNKVTYADKADILFYQVAPGQTISQITNYTRMALKLGKPLNFFELERQEAREKSRVALGAGAFAVGNW